MLFIHSLAIATTLLLCPMEGWSAPTASLDTRPLLKADSVGEVGLNSVYSQPLKKSAEPSYIPFSSSSIDESYPKGSGVEEEAVPYPPPHPQHKVPSILSLPVKQLTNGVSPEERRSWEAASSVELELLPPPLPPFSPELPPPTQDGRRGGSEYPISLLDQVSPILW